MGTAFGELGFAVGAGAADRLPGTRGCAEGVMLLLEGPCTGANDGPGAEAIGDMACDD